MDEAAGGGRGSVAARLRAARPDEKWVADFTYIRTWNGFIYLAFILDCLQPDDRRLAASNPTCATELVVDALGDGQRPPATDPGVADRALRSRFAIHEHMTTPTTWTSAASPPAGSHRDGAATTPWPRAWVATFKSELVRRAPLPLLRADLELETARTGSASTTNAASTAPSTDRHLKRSPTSTIKTTASTHRKPPNHAGAKPGTLHLAVPSVGSWC